MPNTRRKLLLVLLMGCAIGLTLAGCANGPATPAAQPTRAPSGNPPLPTIVSPLSPIATPMKPLARPTSLPGSRAIQSDMDPVALQETNAALDDLSKRTGIPKSDIKVVSVEAVDWPDSSVGCPQPDRMYAQVITPGYRIILEAGGKIYDYHSAGVGVSLCEPQPPS